MRLQNSYRRRLLSLSLFSACTCIVHGFSTTPTSRLPQQSTSTVTASSSPSSFLFYTKVQEWLESKGIAFSPTASEAIQLLSKDLLDCEDETSSLLPQTRLLALKKKDDNATSPSIALHLIPTPTCAAECLHPLLIKTLTDNIAQKDHLHGGEYAKKIIHLHEDVWHQKPKIVRARLLAQLGVVSRRIFARRTMARRIDATQAMEFLQEHHLWGATRAKYYYGLFEKKTNHKEGCKNGQPVLQAVATFSNRRRVLRNGKTFRSHEMLRFCTQRNTAVPGGLSKLLSAFCKDQHPNDIVTVVDRNWGTGDGWASVGFSSVAVLDPIVMAVSPREPGVRRAFPFGMNKIPPYTHSYAGSVTLPSKMFKLICHIRSRFWKYLVQLTKQEEDEQRR